MKYNFFANVIIFLMTYMFSIESVSSTPKTYSATYSLKKNGIEFGRSEHRLTFNPDTDEWCMNSLSYTVGIFSIKKDERIENSCFKYIKNNHLNATAINLDKNDFIITNTYTYKRIKSNKNHTVKVKRVDNNLVTTVNGNITENNDNASIDRLVAQMFGYTLKKIKVNDKGRQRQYNFEVVRKETVSSIFGLTESLVVKKNIYMSKRSTLTWYSTENNYVPVLIEQYRLNELKFTATLIDFRD